MEDKELSEEECRETSNTKSIEKHSGMEQKLVNSPDLAWKICFYGITIAALITRLSYLNELPGTTWDEVHFGGFANKYIKRTMYNDVHPPLGKIFVAAAAYVTGYRGDFNFTEGTFFDDTIRYQLIRSEMAVIGALIVPVSFMTTYTLTQSAEAAFMGALGILCDTFMHKMNTLILLDPLLNLALCCAVLCSFKVHSYRESEFSFTWWKWLFFTGLSLGIVVSIKYIGIFTVLFVGLHTAYQLYTIASDGRNSVIKIVMHTIARVFALILFPILIYLGAFVLHLLILTETTPHTGAWLHTRFYSGLNNTEYDNKTFPQYVNYGATITIQTSSLHVGYLDSTYDLYPSELTAACQVVSMFSGIRDPEYTDWTMKFIDTEKGTIVESSDPNEAPLVVKNGDWVILTHIDSQRSLRSHGRRAPYTRNHYQACCYGENGTVGPFETWQIVLPNEPIGTPLKVFSHDFMLKNYAVDCYLSTSDVALEKSWSHPGSKEVSCTRNRNYPKILWHINWIKTNKSIGETTAKEHRMGLWEQIVHIHKIMFDINSGLKPIENEDVSISSSSPWMWPLVYQMQVLASYQDTEDGTSTYAMGSYNPMVAYVNIAAFAMLYFIAIHHYYKVLRDPLEPEESIRRREKVLWTCLWLSLCWAIHYLPFYFMNRILYLHHYSSAYIYSCLITGIVLNHLSEVISENLNTVWPKLRFKKCYLLIIPSVAFIMSYVFLYPLATSIDGEPFDQTKINTILDKFYFGQLWPQLGYENKWYTDKIHAILYTEMEDFESIENPYVNSSLYYTEKLNATKLVNKTEINPVAASNFSHTHFARFGSQSPLQEDPHKQTNTTKSASSDFSKDGEITDI